MAQLTLDGDGPKPGREAARLTDGEKRARKAHTQAMLVQPQTDSDGFCTGMYDVHRPGGTSYVVDLLDEDGGRCTCPDHQHRPEIGCKHIRRVTGESAEGDLPKPGQDATEYLHGLDVLKDDLEAEVAELEERAGELRSFVNVLNGVAD